MRLVELLITLLGWGLAFSTVAHDAAFPEPPPRVLRAAGEAEFPPLIEREGDEITGFALELLRAAAREHEVRFAPGPSHRNQARLAAGELDVLPVMARTPEKAAAFDLSAPYISLHGSIWVRRDGPRIRGLEDLRGKAVAVARGSGCETFLRQRGFEQELTVTDRVADALRQLERGKHDAVVAYDLVGERLRQRLDLTRVRQVDPDFWLFRQDFSFAVAKGNHPLLARLNQGMNRIAADGTWSRLGRRWLAQPSPRVWPVVVISMLASALVVGVLAWLWQGSLRAMVDRRTAELRAATRQLAWQRDFSDALLDAAASIVVVLDPRGRVVRFNQAAERATGYTLAELETQSFSELFLLPEERADVEAVFAAICRGNVIRHHENHWRARDGGQRLIAWANAVLHDGDGKVEYLISIGTDITEFRALQDQLRAREAQLLTLINATPDLIFLKDGTGHWLEANTAGLRLFGLSDLEWRGKTDHELARIASPRFTAALNACDASDHVTWQRGETTRQEEVVPTLDESQRVLDVIKVPLYDEDQHPKGLVILARDITERKRMEQDLYLWAHVFTHADWGVVLCRADSQCFDFVNPTFARQRGYTVAELEGFGIADLFPAEQRAAIPGILKSLEQRGHLRLEGEHLRKDGSRFPVEIEASAIHDPQGRMIYRAAYVQDISERKAVEQRLRVFEQMVSATRDWMAFVDRDHVFRMINERYAFHFGRAREDLIGHHASEILDPELYREWVAPRLERCLAGETIHFQRWFAIHDAQRFLDVSYAPYQEENQTITGAVVTVHDITDLKETEAELRAESERLALAVEAAGIGIWEWNLDQQRLIWDARMLALFQIEPDAFDESLEDWRQAILPSDRNAAWRVLWRAIKGPETQFEDHYRIRVADGSTRHIQAHAKIRRDEQGQAIRVIGANWDTTGHHELLARLASGERRFRTLIEASPAGIYETDAEGRYLLVNPGWRKMAGFARANDALGHGWLLGVSPRDRDDIAASWPRLVASGERFELEYRFVGPQGAITWVSSTSAPIRDEYGRITGYIGINTDITPRKRKEQETRRYQKQLDETQRLANIGGWRYEPTTQTLVWSNQMFCLHGLPVEAGLRPWRALRLVLNCHERADRHRAITELRHALTYGTPFDSVYSFTNYQGKRMWIRSLGRPVLKEGKVILLKGVVMDITAQQNLADELRRARDLAETANRAKSAFIANMSHELRTPLNAIMGYAHLLNQGTDLSEEQHNALAAITRGGDYLLLLINDVLDLAKVEAGRLELFVDECDLARFLSGLDELFELRARHKGIAYRHRAQRSLPVTVRVDEKRLRQVCMNLLGNAMKFTEQGEVWMESEYRDGMLSIAVSDTGIGIPAHRLSSLFTPFMQLGDEHYKNQGTGLGLAISQSLIRQMGGKITVTSTPGEGSRFAFSIPAPTVVARAETEPPKDTGRVVGYQRLDEIDAPLRILVVDDDESNRRILNKLLRRAGFLIDEAHGGEAAIARAEESPPDLICMDLAMPGVDGLEATRRILATRPELPIIAISACAFEADRANSLAAGCREFLTKPIEFRALRATLARHLPLRWEYRSHPALSPARSETFTRSALQARLAELPASLTQPLAEAIARGNGKAIQQALSLIREQAPSLAAALKQRVGGYEYEFLLDVLGSPETEAPREATPPDSPPHEEPNP